MSQVHRITHLLLMAVLLAPLAVHGAVLEGFYRVVTPIGEDQDRDQALRQAAELMVVRQAGSQALDNDAVQAALQDPRALMRRIAGSEAGSVQVDFEPAVLRELLTGAGLPVLGPNRPAVMLWAVENGTFGPELLGQGSEWTEVLNGAASRRAVALSLPLADLEDRTLVDVGTIEEADEQTLRRASERYDASAVLALSIGDAAGEQVLEWNWWLNEQTDGGRISAETRLAAADQLMLRVADLVVAQYGVMPSSTAQTSRWQIVVKGVDTVGEFAGLQRTLQQLGTTQAPRVLSVQGDEVSLVLQFPGSAAQLERLLALDQRLRRLPDPEPEVAPVIETAELPMDDSAATTPSSPDGEASAEAPDALAAPADQADEAPEELQASEQDAASVNVMYFRWR